MSLVLALLPYFIAYCFLSLCVGLVLGRVLRTASPWEDGMEMASLPPARIECEPAAIALLGAIMPS